MKKVTCTITNQRGLHARSAANFVALAANFDCRIQVNLGQASADGMSLIELMVLGAKHGDTLTITADGKDATEALTALAKLVEDGFGENDDGNST